ncbi:MAG: hypothetical protein GKR92_05370 [Gammaproteobacteria bacterium]|nr:MAG: hypothetical protein GKR92_05370 [Gammaproteobacteria bacterium]
MAGSVDIKEVAAILLEESEGMCLDILLQKHSPQNIRTKYGPILRRHLVHGDIDIIQNHLILQKFKPILFRYSHSEVNTQALALNVNLFWLERIIFNGIEFGMPPNTTTPTKKKNRAPRKIKVKETNAKPKKFIDQCMCVHQGSQFSRYDFIKFHVNYLGGAHLSKPAEDQLRLRETVAFDCETPGNIKILMGAGILQAKMDDQRRRHIYELADLVLLDTALHFCKSVVKRQKDISQLSSQ